MRNEFWEARAALLSPFNGSGLSIKGIAKKVGFDPATVSRYAEIYGFDFATGRKAPAFGPSSMERKIEKIRECARAGKTRQQAAEEVGISAQSVGIHARKNGIQFIHGSKGVGVDSSRAGAMAGMYRGGKTLEEIGQCYGITRERVRQIISKECNLSAVDGGSAVRAAREMERRAKARDEKCLIKHGCSHADYVMLRDLGSEMYKDGVNRERTPVGAFNRQKTSATNRGIEWNLKLWDWWNVWQVSGKWSERGRGADKYVMCRFKDNGAYEVGNVYVATHSHNSSFQPNNPYRVGHPDHEKVMAEARKKRHRSLTRKKINSKYDLPLGVTFQKGRYIAQISVSGKNKHLGSFGTPGEAHAAYLAKAEELALRVAA